MIEINHDRKTSCGLIRDGLFPNWNFAFVFVPRLHYLQLLVLDVFIYSSFLWRTDTIVFAEYKKTPPPPPQKSPPSLLSPSQNVFERRNLRGGGLNTVNRHGTNKPVDSTHCRLFHIQISYVLSNPGVDQLPQNNNHHKKGLYATKLRIPHDSYD